MQFLKYLFVRVPVYHETNYTMFSRKTFSLEIFDFPIRYRMAEEIVFH